MNIYDYIINDYKPEMGKRIRTCRQQSKLTQENMAEILDISVKHYSEIERGITGLSIEKLLFLSDYFRVSLDYLLKGDGKRESLPFILIEAYSSCPDKKKDTYIDLIKTVHTLLNDKEDD
ncbi:MAG: helix-turn-helix transcriptional regulator [Lachnospiraceae bacterium]|nr:helix-turn-helix transcriptional regulator [Lachnospiraceae bacterium]